MTFPRLIVLAIYPLLLLAAALAAYQTRLLAQAMPSQAWNVKVKVMIFFAGVQVYGFAQNIIYSRQSNWTGAGYFTCTLVFLLGLNWFDYCLLKSYKRMRARAAAMIDLPTSGELSIEEWQKQATLIVEAAIRNTLKVECLKPRE